MGKILGIFLVILISSCTRPPQESWSTWATVPNGFWQTSDSSFALGSDSNSMTFGSDTYYSNDIFDDTISAIMLYVDTVHVPYRGGSFTIDSTGRAHEVMSYFTDHTPHWMFGYVVITGNKYLTELKVPIDSNYVVLTWTTRGRPPYITLRVSGWGSDSKTGDLLYTGNGTGNISSIGSITFPANRDTIKFKPHSSVLPDSVIGIK